MSFKVGDKVRVKKAPPNFKGCVGKVIELDTIDTDFVRLRFAKTAKRPGCSIWCYVGILELVEPSEGGE